MLDSFVFIMVFLLSMNRPVVTMEYTEKITINSSVVNRNVFGCFMMFGLLSVWNQNSHFSCRFWALLLFKICIALNPPIQKPILPMMYSVALGNMATDDVLRTVAAVTQKMHEKLLCIDCAQVNGKGVRGEHMQSVPDNGDGAVIMAFLVQLRLPGLIEIQSSYSGLALLYVSLCIFLCLFVTVSVFLGSMTEFITCEIHFLFSLFSISVVA